MINFLYFALNQHSSEGMRVFYFIHGLHSFQNMRKNVFP